MIVIAKIVDFIYFIHDYSLTKQKENQTHIEKKMQSKC
jgi:hypothetical protein